MRYWPLLKRFSWIILLGVVMGGVVGALVARTIPPGYQVVSTLLVTEGVTGNNPTDLSTIDNPTLSINIANGYAAEMLTRAFLLYTGSKYPELKKHGLGPDVLAADVIPAPGTTAATITITAVTTSPRDSVMVVNDMADAFVSYIQQREQNNLNTLHSSLQNQLDSLKNQQTALEKQVESVSGGDTHFTVYLNELQALNQEINTVAGQFLLLPDTVRSDVVVLQHAKLGDVISSNKGLTILALIVVGGLLIGFLVMLEVIFLNFTPLEGNLIQEKLGMAYLGGFLKHKEWGAFPLQLSGKRLREVADVTANLQLAALLPEEYRAPNGAILLVSSTKAAAGTTTAAVALATTLVRVGRSVVLVEANLRRPSLHKALGVNASGPGLGNLLKGSCSIDAAVVRSTLPGLWFMSAGESIEDPALLIEQKMPLLLAQLRAKADLVILDGSPLLKDANAAALASLADGIVFVVNGRRDRMPLLLRVKDILNTTVRKPTGVIVNYAPPQRKNRYYVTSPVTPQSVRVVQGSVS